MSFNSPELDIGRLLKPCRWRALSSVLTNCTTNNVWTPRLITRFLNQRWLSVCHEYLDVADHQPFRIGDVEYLPPKVEIVIVRSGRQRDRLRAVPVFRREREFLRAGREMAGR